MSDEKQSDRDIEFDAIAEAIEQNPRGRWFLNEYARRNRSADTDLLVNAIEHLYKAALKAGSQSAVPAPQPTPMPEPEPEFQPEPEPMAEPEPVHPVETTPIHINLDIIRHALADMRLHINSARRDIATVKPRETENFKNPEDDATEVATSAERATLDILAAVERLQDIADTLRANGTDGDLCDEIETHARGIFMSSAYQDMTGQRIAVLVKALAALDNRIGAVLSMDELSDD